MAQETVFTIRLEDEFSAATRRADAALAEFNETAGREAAAATAALTVNLTRAEAGLELFGAEAAENAAQASAALTGTAKAATGLKAATGAVGGFASSLKGLAAAAVGLVAVQQTIGFLREGFAGAQSGEQALAALAAAATNAGAAARAAVPEFQDLAGELQKTLGVSDDATLRAAALGLQMRLTAAQVKQLLPVAADLAAGLGTDLQSALALAGKAVQGQSSILVRQLSPAFKQAFKDAKTFDERLRVLSAFAGGQAAAQANTLAGRLNILNEATGEAAEGFVAALGHSRGLNIMLQSLTETLFGVADAAGDSTAATGLLDRAIAAGLDGWLLLKTGALGAKTAVEDWGMATAQAALAVGAVFGKFGVLVADGLAGALDKLAEFSRAIAGFADRASGALGGILPEGLGDSFDSLGDFLDRTGAKIGNVGAAWKDSADVQFQAIFDIGNKREAAQLKMVKEVVQWRRETAALQKSLRAPNELALPPALPALGEVDFTTPAGGGGAVAAAEKTAQIRAGIERDLTRTMEAESTARRQARLAELKLDEAATAAGAQRVIAARLAVLREGFAAEMQLARRAANQRAAERGAAGLTGGEAAAAQAASRAQLEAEVGAAAFAFSQAVRQEYAALGALSEKFLAERRQDEAQAAQARQAQLAEIAGAWGQFAQNVAAGAAQVRAGAAAELNSQREAAQARVAALRVEQAETGQQVEAIFAARRAAIEAHRRLELEAARATEENALVLAVRVREIESASLRAQLQNVQARGEALAQFRSAEEAAAKTAAEREKARLAEAAQGYESFFGDVLEGRLNSLRDLGRAVLDELKKKLLEYLALQAAANVGGGLGGILSGGSAGGGGVFGQLFGGGGGAVLAGGAGAGGGGGVGAMLAPRRAAVDHSGVITVQTPGGGSVDVDVMEAVAGRVATEVIGKDLRSGRGPISSQLINLQRRG